MLQTGFGSATIRIVNVGATGVVNPDAAAHYIAVLITLLKGRHTDGIATRSFARALEVGHRTHCAADANRDDYLWSSVPES
jgi:hypothetical protein